MGARHEGARGTRKIIEPRTRCLTQEGGRSRPRPTTARKESGKWAAHLRRHTLQDVEHLSLPDCIRRITYVCKKAKQYTGVLAEPVN